MRTLPRRWRRFQQLFRLSADEGITTQMLAWSENRHKGRLRPNYEVRNDLRRISAGEGVRIEVFWKDLPIGRGPAASVFMLDEEILRFDCFGADDGHMHAAYFLPVRGESRLRLRETTVEAQIDRTVFEIEHNLDYYQARNADPQIRQLQVDRERLHRAMTHARKLMCEFAQLG